MRLLIRFLFFTIFVPSFFVYSYSPTMFQLDIVDPPNMGSIGYLPAEFGSNIIVQNITDGLTAQVVKAWPDPKLCTVMNTTSTGESYAGKIILVYRGSCLFTQKAANAVAMGALMLIVYSCASECDSSAPRMTGNINSTAEIPCIALKYSDGARIASVLDSGGNVTIHTEGTNSILPSELVALRNFATAMQYNVPPVIYSPIHKSGQVRDWTVLLSSDLAVVGDPCLSRVTGTWCLSGRIVDIYSGDLNPTGFLPSGIGMLTALRAVDLSQKTLNGTIPCIGQLSELRELKLGTNNFTGFTNDPLCWPTQKLELIDLKNNRLPLFPPIGNAVLLKSVDMSNNRIANMIDLSLFSRLETLNLNANQINASLPSFTTLQNLTTLQLSKNSFFEADITSSFDSLPKLTTLDLSYNSIGGAVPNFQGTLALITVDLSHNNFTGNFSGAWNLTALQVIRFGHNQITSLPLNVFTRSIVLQELDASYNLIPISPPHNLFTNILPPTVLIVNFESNLISGVWLPQYATFNGKIQKLKLGKNQLTGIPSTLWTELNNLQYFDVSNNILQGTLPPTTPPRVVGNAFFDDNPQFGPGGIPPYVQQNFDQLVLAREGNSSFLCPTMTGLSSDLQLKLDPYYYSYQGCVCEQGTFGIPPNCQFIPLSTNVVTNGSFTQITDEIFGTERLQSGVNTVWSFTRSFAPEEVKVVEFTITFYSDFNGFDDVLSLFEGGSDLRGTRIVLLRGDESKPKMRSSDYQINSTTYLLRVFSPTASLTFQSPDTNGNHFEAEVSFSEVCPIGFSDELGTKCREVIDYSPSNSVSAIIYVLMSLGLVLMFATFFVVVTNLDLLLIRASSPMFCVITLAGLAIFAIAPVTYIMKPSDHVGVCNMRVWLTALPLVMLLSSLLVKVDRIRNIFSTVVFSDLQKQYRKFTNERLLAYVSIMLISEVFLLIIFSALQLSKPILTEGPGSDDTTLYLESECSTDSMGWRVWFGFQIGYVGLFLLWGAYLAFQTKDTPTAFNESTHILGALMEIIFLAVVIVPLNFMLQDAAGVLLIRGIGQTFAALTLTCVIFGPKLYYIFTGHGNDTAMLHSSSIHHKTEVSETPSKGQYKPAPKSAQNLPSIVRAESSMAERTELSELPDDLGKSSSSGTVDLSPRHQSLETPRFDGSPRLDSSTPKQPAILEEVEMDVV